MSKQQSINVGGQTAPAPTDPALIRNVVLVGPSSSGKTTLAESLLSATTAITRPGSVVEGTTVCDHESAAVEQQRRARVTERVKASPLGVGLRGLSQPARCDEKPHYRKQDPLFR